MTAYSVVRFRVNPGQESEFEAIYASLPRNFPGVRNIALIRDEFNNSEDGEDDEITPTKYFAVGEWAAVGAFGAFTALTILGLPWLLAVPFVIVVMFAVGGITEIVTVRPLVEKGAPILAPILALLATLVILREVIGLSFGPDPQSVPYPLGFKRIEIGPLGGSPQNFLIIGSTLAIFAGAWLFFERTVWGRIFEAVAINRRAAALMGINLSRVTAMAFAAGAAVPRPIAQSASALLLALSAPRKDQRRC